MKTVKKTFGAVVCLAGILSAAVGFAACEDHEHTWSTDWSKDATNHWHECTADDCDEKGSSAAHTYGEWAVVTAATEQALGKEERACTVCDYTESREIAKLKPADDKKDDDKDDGNNNELEEHEHDWSDWTVADKPTDEKEGKATRTCANDDCDADDEDKEHTLPTLDSEDYETGADSATCLAAGSIKYTYNKDGVEVEFDVATEKKAHAMAHADADPATCTENGTLEYWHCSLCGYDYADADGETKLDSTVDVTEGHTMEYSPARPEGCTEDGAYEYWHCTKCENDYADEHGTLPIADTVKPASHKLNFVNGKDATCEGDGVLDHWHCTVCENDFEDAKGEVPLEDTSIPSNGHLAIHNPAVYPCEEEGNLEYWTCDYCGELFLDADCTQIADADELILPQAGHQTTAVAAVASANSGKSVKKPDGTTANIGNIAHYECEVCGKLFKDEEATNEITVVNYTSASRCGLILNSGFNKVDVTGEKSYVVVGSNYMATYIAGSSAKYTFTFDEGIIFTSVVYILKNTSTSVSTYTSSGWNTASAAYDKFIVEDATQPVGNSITAVMEKGEWITFVVNGTSMATAGIYTINIEEETLLFYGKNTVTITEANAVDVDVYQFIPSETKTYSITVPKGLSADMGEFSDWYIEASISEVTENFEGVKGEVITFNFTSSIVGSYQVEIGEGLLTVIIPDEDFAVTKYPGLGATYTFQVADGVEEGEYNLTFKNGSREAFYIAINFEGEIQMDGSNVVAQSDWVYYGAPNFTRKFTLKGGDTITLINPTNERSFRDPVFTLTQA